MEKWNDIKGLEGFYQVSNKGRVRSLDRIDSRGCKRKGAIKQPGNASAKGYYVVSLYKEGKQYMRYIHRLVAEAFIGEIPTGYVVNHINEDWFDNDVTNLEVVTQKKNVNHSLNLGYKNAERIILI